MLRPTCIFLTTVFLVATSFGQQKSSRPQAAASKAAVDQLIPWLLDEEAQLRGIPFSEVIVDVTGKKVLAFDPKDEVDQRVRKAISAACDEATKRLNVHGQIVAATCALATPTRQCKQKNNDNSLVSANCAC